MRPEERYSDSRKSRSDRVYIVLTLLAVLFVLGFVFVDLQATEPQGPPQIGADPDPEASGSPTLTEPDLQ